MSARCSYARRSFALLLSIACASGAALGGCGVTEESAARAESGALCADCHDTPPAHGEHAGLACGGCHSVDHELADRLSWSTTGLAELPDHAEITACGACHEDRPRTATATEGHRSHAHVEGRCASCHASVHVGAEPAACASCHGGVERHGPTAEVTCTGCHAFAPERPGAPEASDLAALAGVADLGAGAHGRPPITTRVHGGVDCRSCHDPHASEEAPVDCQSCHRGYLAEQVRSSSHDSCGDCHEAHGDPDRPAVDCLGCHRYPEEGHGWSVIPGGVTDAMRAQTRARITHEGDCASCHDPHTSVASPERCAGCHEEQRDALATLPAGPHEQCRTCHEPHEPAPTAAVCASCHDDVHARDANVPEHRDCLSCHEPHHGRPEPRAACASCHSSAHAETLASARPHRDCGHCHEEHGAPLAPTASACASCHEAPTRALAVASGVPAEHHRCGSCHEQHGFAGEPEARARCASCHRDAVSAHASHRGACTSCHDEHGAPLGASSDCASCHEDVHPRLAGHEECASCHAPHRAAVEALSQCGSCHGAEVASGTRWPRASPHAGECTACHVQHDETTTPLERGGSRATLCRSCHVRESSRAHTGPHEDCIGCHAPHAAPATASGLASAWWSSCASCHAAEASAVAASDGTHAQCASCHRSPGPPLPRCESCHGEEDRRLAHLRHTSAQDPRLSCTSCHAAHGTTPPAPARCLACHEDQRAAGHFLDAPSCSSCHPFR